jgi:hypothetical protein
MQVREVPQIPADHEQVKEFFVNEIELRDGCAGSRVADVKAGARDLARRRGRRRQLDVERLGIADASCNRYELHLADWTALAGGAANTRMHGAPVLGRRDGQLYRSRPGKTRGRRGHEQEHDGRTDGDQHGRESNSA